MKVIDGIDNASQRGTNFADPTAAQDAATKNYVDTHAAPFPPTRVPTNQTFTIPDDSGIVVGWGIVFEANSGLVLGANSALVIA